MRLVLERLLALRVDLLIQVLVESLSAWEEEALAAAELEHSAVLLAQSLRLSRLRILIVAALAA